MSEGLAESAPQQSAPPPVIGGEAPLSPQVAVGTPTTPEEVIAGEQVSELQPTEIQLGAEATEQAPTEQPEISDDWRRAMAGDDDALLTELSRHKTQQDVAKQVLRQKQELSKRTASGPFPTDGDETAQQEWRDFHGVPAEGTMEGYGIKTPEGYELSEVESGMLGEFVKDIHGSNAPKEYVQKTVDKWFQMNAANAQNVRVVDEGRHEDWSKAVHTDLGDDYEPVVAASNAFIEQRIEDPEVRGELLNARLPGGGILARHPEFIKLVGDLALQNGYGDRIEANSIESNGKSLGEQQSELEGLRNTNASLYNAPATQAKLDKIIGLRLSRGEIDELGNPVKGSRR